MPITEDYYPLQNEHIRASIGVSEAEEKYVRHEIDEAELKKAHARAETAFLALEKYWASLDAKKEKEK